MKKTIDISAKRTYSIPQIELITLDNEISLALESDPAFGPGETMVGKKHDYFNNDPFKNTMA